MLSSCRACQGTQLHLFLPLGDHPLANGFLPADRLDQPEPMFPLDVHACLDCGLIQVADQIPTGFFRHYVYIPSAADAMHGHFAGLADRVYGRFIAGGDGLTVDIGCNDGLFLGHLHRRGARTLGIDPAENIAELARARGLKVITEYFSPALARDLRQQYGPAQVIVTTNTYHHIGNLDPFTLAVTELLAEDGVFLIEVPYALELVETNQFDGVYHEHVSQFTVKSIVDHLRRFGLEVFDVERLAVHGGSMRVMARRATSPDELASPVADLITHERQRGLFRADTYDAFRNRVEVIRDKLLALLHTLKGQGKRIAGYGASARGNTLLNYYGIGPALLDYLVDRNPLKHGLYSPGMHVPVVGADRLIADPPDFLLLLAWNFGEEVIRQQQAFQAAGGRFILPIPEVSIVGESPAPTPTS